MIQESILKFLDAQDLLDSVNQTNSISIGQIKQVRESTMIEVIGVDKS